MKLNCMLCDSFSFIMDHSVSYILDYLHLAYILTIIPNSSRTIPLMDCVFSESGLIFESDGPVPFLFEFGVL